MFQWLASLRYGRGEGLNEGWTQPNQWSREVASRADDLLRDFHKKDRLVRELRNAEWILDYEKRLISLQEKTATQRSRTEQAGADTERLRRLEHHLAGLRQSLD